MPDKSPYAKSSGAGFSGRGAFRSTTPDASLFAQRSMSKLDWKVLGGIMIVAVFVRLWGLDWPASVVFDEVHFGGFAKKYVIGRFFFDVHPPLAKMLFAVFAFLGGFDGDTDFDFTPIGEDYIRNQIPYITMRMLPALCGLGTICMCYATLRASGCRTSAAAIGALILTFENTFITESRYILLDAPLVFFISIVVYAFKRFENTVPFRSTWFRYLFLTGLALGATVSSKWVGFFTFGWVGTLTVYQLWWIWGDLNVGLPNFVKQFTFRAFFLLGVPFLIYVGMFVLHFFCVDNYGNGADLLPRWFQASLKHNHLPVDIPANVAFGSVVSMRHADTQGGWLHSHIQTYPTGSEQQQVTLYSHVDDNNLWRITNGTEDWNPENKTGPVSLTDGAIVRLEHIATQRRLHSHDHRAPVTNKDYVFEVSAYGFEGFEGDWNDNWKVKILGQRSYGDGKDSVRSLQTYFQLEHLNLGCQLYSKNVKLPDWGFEQQEVSCIRGGKDFNTVWVVESNVNPELPGDTELVNYPIPGFWQKFGALNKAMWDINKDLTDPHTWESRPSEWLILNRGINMWGETNRQVYLIGNLPVYWFILGSVIVLVLVKAVRVLAWQHLGYNFAPSSDNSALALFDAQFGRYALGWWFHLFPSFLMVRQLFLHHYLASLYFGVLMIGQTAEFLLSCKCRPQISRTVIALFFTSVLVWYYLYAPLAYGTPWTRQECEARKFFDMDFQCDIFFEDISLYKDQAVELKESKSSAYAGLILPTPTDAEEEQAHEEEVAEQHYEEEQPQETKVFEEHLVEKVVLRENEDHEQEVIDTIVETTLVEKPQ